MVEARPELPLIPYLVLPDIFLCILIAVQAPPVLRLLGFVLHTYVSAHGLRFTTGDRLQDYGIGSAFSGQFFTALHLLWLTRPVNEFRHENDRVGRSTSELPLWKRVWWTFSVNHSPRGVGWSYQVRHTFFHTHGVTNNRRCKGLKCPCTTITATMVIRLLTPPQSRALFSPR